MANSYNSNPIALDTVMASGWRSLQTLNTGNLPSTAQQLSGAVTRQWGINVTLVVWTNIAAAGNTFQILDPNDSTVLLQGQAGSTADQTYFLDQRMGQWRDFKLTIISAGSKLLIYYRA